MKKLVTISREYGSGGRTIGKLVADKLNVPFYDKEIIEMAVEGSDYSKEVLETAELRAKSSIIYSLAAAFSFSEGQGESLPVNDKLFLAQFQVIKEIGETDAGVIIGRCADYVLKDKPGVTNIFIHAEKEDRIRRAIEKYGVSEERAQAVVDDYDKARANYYSYHTSNRWGDYRNYNLSINTSYISEEKTAEMIVDYIKNRKYRED